MEAFNWSWGHPAVQISTNHRARQRVGIDWLPGQSRPQPLTAEAALTATMGATSILTVLRTGPYTPFPLPDFQSPVVDEADVLLTGMLFW